MRLISQIFQMLPQSYFYNLFAQINMLSLDEGTMTQLNLKIDILTLWNSFSTKRTKFRWKSVENLKQKLLLQTSNWMKTHFSSIWINIFARTFSSQILIKIMFLFLFLAFSPSKQSSSFRYKIWFSCVFNPFHNIRAHVKHIKWFLPERI